MDLLSYVMAGKNNDRCRCCCCNSRSSKRLNRSCIDMHKFAITVCLLFFCVDYTFAQSGIQTHPKLTLSVPNGLTNPSLERRSDNAAAPDEETQRKLEPPTDLLKDITKDGIEVDPLSPESKGLFLGEDANGVPIVLGTWFRYGSYTLAFCMFGTAFLVACVLSAIYYVLFVVTEPSQQVRSMASEEAAWNTGRILRAIQLAYETYQTFDPYRPSCQLKIICEIQESRHFEASALKRLSHFIIHTDLVQKKMANAGDLQAADRIGNDPAETCIEKFSECRFSLDKVYEKYVTM